MKKRIVSVSIIAVLAMMILTACGGVGLPNIDLSPTQAAPNQPAASAPTLTSPLPAQPVVPSGASGDLLEAYQGTLENIYKTVSPSVVNIQVVEQVAASGSDSNSMPGFPFFNLPQGQDQQPQPQFQSALGSGFVWDQEGHIVTNNHVVNGADKIEVTFSDGTTVPATLVGADPDSDLAVLKVDVSADKLHPVQMADSKSIQVGQLAIAIGNPFGLEGSMTTGIISALGRSLPVDETSLQSYTIPDIIQTDAPINPGNSGGILVDAQGQVLGVTSAIESPVRANAGVGFAIPSAIVKNVVPALIKDGKYVHSWLGISGTSLIPDLAKAMNLDLSQRGALVEEVMPNSPAEKAGLRGSNQQTTIEGQTVNVGGDVITAIDNQKVLQMDELIAYLAGSTKVDQKVTLTILRDGIQQNLDVTLAARPSAEEQANANPQGQATQGIRLGILGITVDQSIAREMNLSDGQQGVLIQQVQPGSLADTAGLQGGSKTVTINGQDVVVGGDIITAVNGQSIASVDELRASLEQLPSDHSLTLTILRDGKETQVEVQPGL
ncbi:MAG TPA: trypsin-like peptidase domain-containing protein [Anaerolineales bacterium]